MYEFSEKEIDLISCDIDQQGLTYTLLKNELLDHICCSIEEEMEKGMSFNDAYRKIKKQIGSRRIRQIQDETLYLVNKKYRRMKKLMYGLGIAIPIVIVLAIVFKVMHWPGGGPLFTLALILLALVFLPLFAMVKIRDTRKLDEEVPLVFYLTGLFAAILTIIGVLFKIQHMYGAGILMSVGFGGLALVFLPMYAVLKKREAEKKQEPFNTVTYVFGVLVGILFIAGALFKIMHWPGAGYVLVTSWVAASVVLLPLLVMNILKKESNRLGNFTMVILLFTAVSMLTLTRMNRDSPRVITGMVISESALAEDAVYLKNKCNALMDKTGTGLGSEILSSIERVRSEADALSAYILELQGKLAIEGRYVGPSHEKNNGRILFSEVPGLDSYKATSKIMFGRDDAPMNADKLRAMLGSFRETALSATDDPSLRSLVESRLGLDVPEFWDETWGEALFSGSLMQTANHLSIYRYTVHLIEYEVLQEILSGV